MNRQLGDFLKELRLTKAHATGLPALRKAMKLNGSEILRDIDGDKADDIAGAKVGMNMDSDLKIKVSKSAFQQRGIVNKLEHDQSSTKL